MNFKFKLSSKPEKTILALTISMILAIFFDDQKKKRGKHPERYRNYSKRVKDNYSKIDDILKKTVARDLYKNVPKYDSEILQNLKIERGETIDL